jgi:hypothetical protein
MSKTGLQPYSSSFELAERGSRMYLPLIFSSIKSYCYRDCTHQED